MHDDNLGINSLTSQGITSGQSPRLFLDTYHHNDSTRHKANHNAPFCRHNTSLEVPTLSLMAPDVVPSSEVVKILSRKGSDAFAQLLLTETAARHSAAGSPKRGADRTSLKI